MRQRVSSGWIVVLGLLLSAACLVRGDEQPPTGDATVRSASISGEELFRREWLPDDPRSHGGDGLGPVFNDTSCVACHNQGGAGGAGPSAKNVELLTAVASGPPAPQAFARFTLGDLKGDVREVSATEQLIRSLSGLPIGPTAAPKPESDGTRQQTRELLAKRREWLAKRHPGFERAQS